MRKVLFLYLALCTSPSLADTTSSAVFQLDTAGLIGQSISSSFSCTTQQRESQSSAVFNCTTDQLRGQLASAVFLCNSFNPEYGSGLFIADTHSLLTDSNTNGLPNIWEYKYFGATTAANPVADPDQDESDNLSEYIAGTNPQDWHSLFSLLIYRDGYVEWPSVLNRTYTLQYTPTLTEPFSDVAGQTEIQGTGFEMAYPYTSLQEKGFYRVNVRLSE